MFLTRISHFEKNDRKDAFLPFFDFVNPKLYMAKMLKKILNEAPEIRDNLRRFGVLKASYDCFTRMINSFIYLKIFRCLKFTLETLNPLFLKRNSKYQFEMLTIDDLLALKGKREDWIPMDQITASFTKGDSCLKIYDGSRLANYSWYSIHPTMITGDLEVTFNSKDYVYRYKAFTYPDYRGQRLDGIGYAKALQEYSGKGIKGILNIIESNNFSSLKSKYRVGCKNIGSIYVLRFRGKFLTFSKGNFENYELKIKPKKQPISE